KIDPTSGTVTEYPVPTPGSQPVGIAPGPDGNVWLTEAHGNRIGTIDPSGTITEYPIVPAPDDTGPLGSRAITPGPDGNLWFTVNTTNQIGSITTSGTVTEYPISTGSSQPYGITGSPKPHPSTMWFTENNGNKIGKIAV